MDERIKFFVGLDAHKDSTSVAACEVGREPARFVGTIGPDVRGLIKLLAKAGDPAQISVVYEAGPTGYGLYRELCRRGYRCEIVAPSLIPRRTGDRIKNDRRDCLRLAELSRAGELKPIWEHAAQGTPADEGVPVAPGTPLSRQDVMDQEP
jgi:transposase